MNEGKQEKKTLGEHLVLFPSTTRENQNII